MNIIYAAVLFVGALLLILAGFTRYGVWQIERNSPPIGEFKVANKTKMHFVHMKAGAQTDLAPIVFVHGASGNLQDQMSVFAERLKGRADLIFLDRPGHGYSERGPASNAKPDGQAATIAALLDELGIDKAVVAGHSFGGAVTTAFALNHPDKTLGTVFMSPVSHPWPGGISWYYDLTALPVIGRIFSETLALPVGQMRIDSGTACVFAPNEPTQNYAQSTAVHQVLRPYHFRNNAVDVAGLFEYVTETSPRYGEIETPSIIITGNKDTIVLPDIHSTGLDRDIPDSQLLWVKNLGHKSDHVAPDLVIAAIENLNGADNDLPAMRDQIEAQLADDAFGPIENCLDNDEIKARILGNMPEAAKS